MDSPIIVDADAGEFYKQPMFYALGHISRFLDVGSNRVAVAADPDPGRDLQYTAVKRPDGGVAVVLMNQ